MPKNVKLNRRSVGTQSDLEVGQSDVARTGTSKKHFDINSKFSSLCKKSAYRNLLQKSITIDAHGRVNLDCINDGWSRGTQTILEDGSRTSEDKRLRLTREESLEEAVPFRSRSSEVTLSPSLLSQESLPSDVPGTSKVMTFPFQQDSVSFEDPERSVEGSLAVIYSCDERRSFVSGISSMPYTYENQPPPRLQSNEAVLLVQDYQSYDVLNAARRQDSVSPRGRRRRNQNRKKKKRGRKERSNRPVPILPDPSVSTIFVCRICHEGEDIEPLIRPCLCKGSVGYIHAKCLKLWLEQSNTSRCEICGYAYAIRQTRRYSKCFSVTVFLRTIVDRRALTYDLISFVAVTPLCIVGIAMCIRASIVSTAGITSPSMNFQMGNVTRAGMIMLSTTIVIAYFVWLYTLLSYHYKSWKRWYNSCYDVEVIPVYMTSQERLEALQRLEEETRRRSTRMERRGSATTVLQPTNAYHPYGSFFQRRFPTEGRVQSLPQ